MRLKAQSDQVIASEIGKCIQAIRLKKNMSLENIAKSSGISRQTLHLLLNHGKGTVPNLIAVLRSIDELERLTSLLVDVLPSPIQVIRMEGKERQRATGCRTMPEAKSSGADANKKILDW